MLRGLDARPQRYVLSEDELARIRRPVAILWGSTDDRYQAIADGRKQAALIPNARFEVLPGGHEPWLDDLDASASQISRFLSSDAEADRPAAGVT